MQSQKRQNDLCSFPRQTIQYHGNQVYAPTSNAEEAEVERFYEDLQYLLELTPKKDVLFIIGDWNAKVENQETTGVTGKFGLGVRNEAGQRLIEFCQENALVIANTLLPWNYPYFNCVCGLCIVHVCLPQWTISSIKTGILWYYIPKIVLSRQQPSFPNHNT